MNYRVLLGNDDVSTAYGGLDSLPTTLLIDRQGKIASVHVGVVHGERGIQECHCSTAQRASATSAPAASRGALALLTRPGAR